MKKLSLTMLALCAIAMPVSAQQEVVDADAAGRPATDSAGYYKASDMIGMPVQGTDNQELGKVEDLLVDGRTNQIEFLILDTTSVVDLGGELPIVPWTIVNTHYVDNTYIINVPVTIDRIRTAPMITIANLDLRGTPAWRGQVNEFYAAELKDRRVARPELDRDRNDADRPNRDADRNQPDRPRQGQRPRGENTPDAGNRPDASKRPEAGNRPNTSKPESRTTNKPAPEPDAKPKADAPSKPKPDAAPKPDAQPEANRKPNPEKKPANP
jgi:sporulation protein YlmC with PRC-barrel domain